MSTQSAARVTSVYIIHKHCDGNRCRNDTKKASWSMQFAMPWWCNINQSRNNDWPSSYFDAYCLGNENIFHVSSPCTYMIPISIWIGLEMLFSQLKVKIVSIKICTLWHLYLGWTRPVVQDCDSATMPFNFKLQKDARLNRRRFQSIIQVVFTSSSCRWFMCPYREIVVWLALVRSEGSGCYIKK